MVTKQLLRISGDPLDLILFEQTRWSLTEGADGMAEDENYDSIQVR